MQAPQQIPISPVPLARCAALRHQTQNAFKSFIHLLYMRCIPNIIELTPLDSGIISKASVWYFTGPDLDGCVSPFRQQSLNRFFCLFFVIGRSIRPKISHQYIVSFRQECEAGLFESEPAADGWSGADVIDK
jgi:hypothetical protein